MLDEIGEFATLNSIGTMQISIDKLPEDMRRSWVRWSFDVLKKTSQQAIFEHFVEFFHCASEEVNSLYDEALHSPINFINFG